MPTMAEIRAKYPMYADVDDAQLARALHQKHYADMPFEDFAGRVGLKAATPIQYEPPARERRGPSVMDRALRQTALRGKAVASGVLAPVDLAVAGVNKASEWLGSDYRAMDTTDAMNFFGAYESNTPSERLADDLYRGAGAVVGGRGLGEGLQAFGGTTRAVGEVLTQQPGRQLAAAEAGSLASGGVREAGGGELAQMGAGLLAGGVVAGVRAGSDPEPPAVGAFLSERGRAAALGTTDADVQGVLRANINRARAPFQERYEALESSGARIDTLTFDRYTGMPGNARNIEIRPEVRGTLNRVRALFGEDAEIAGIEYGQARTAITVLKEEARAASASQRFEQSRMLRSMAAALESDLDRSALQGAARRVSMDYREQFITPFGKVRKGVTPEADEEAAWAAIRNAKPSRVRSLAGAADDNLRGVVRNRVLRDMVEREEAFTPGQAGSASPVVRDYQRRGLNQFFTAREWEGLTRVTGRLAQTRSPGNKLFRTAVTSGVGAAVGGPGGAAGGALLADRLTGMANTLAGRRFLERMSRARAPEIDSALLAISTIPQVTDNQTELTGEAQ